MVYFSIAFYVLGIPTPCANKSIMHCVIKKIIAAEGGRNEELARPAEGGSHQLVGIKMAHGLFKVFLR